MHFALKYILPACTQQAKYCPTTFYAHFDTVLMLRGWSNEKATIYDFSGRFKKKKRRDALISGETYFFIETL